MIEFHGDNKLLSEFAIMSHRSNNAILKHLVPRDKLSIRYSLLMPRFCIPSSKLTLWLSNGLCNHLKGCKQCVYFASTNSDQVVLRAVGAL